VKGVDIVIWHFIVACMMEWVALLIGEDFSCRVWGIRRRVEV